MLFPIYSVKSALSERSFVMHELSTLLRLIDIAEKTAKENGAERIARLEVDVGEMTGIESRYLHYYFPEGSKGTMLEGAELSVNEIPAQVLCASCEKPYHPEASNDRRCPVCGSAEGKVISGRELSVSKIDIG